MVHLYLSLIQILGARTNSRTQIYIYPFRIQSCIKFFLKIHWSENVCRKTTSDSKGSFVLLALVLVFILCQSIRLFFKVFSYDFLWPWQKLSVSWQWWSVHRTCFSWCVHATDGQFHLSRVLRSCSLTSISQRRLSLFATGPSYLGTLDESIEILSLSLIGWFVASA